MVNNSTVLITGVSGFLGQGLSRYFSTCGFDVVGLDIVSPANNAHIKFFHTVNSMEDELGGILDKYKPGFFINLAGNADVSKSISEPLNDFKLSAQLFSVILESVRKYSHETKILLSSSAAVYGQPKQLPISENDAPHPISPYGYHKWMSELMAEEYSNIFGIQTLAIRIFSAYGAGLKKQILWDLCCKCKKGGNIELGGDGSETRDFIHLDDVCTAAHCILRDGAHQSGIYNVASGEEVSIKSLALLVLAEFGINSDRLIFSGKGRAGDPKNWRADISKLRTLGFAPSVNLQIGVREYVKWFKTLS